jgi:dTDP-4-amino-4,6-dideoxygalactose transaminase
VDKVVSEGINGKMPEICAAMGLGSLDAMENIIATNKANYHLYRSLLEKVPGFELLPYDETERANFQYVVVTVDPERTGLTRDELVKVLESENVFARRYFAPGVHRMEPYRSRPVDPSSRLPVTERLCQRVMVLPNGTAVSKDEVTGVVRVLEAAVRAPEAVRKALAAAPAPVK